MKESWSVLGFDMGDDQGLGLAYVQISMLAFVYNSSELKMKNRDKNENICRLTVDQTEDSIFGLHKKISFVSATESSILKTWKESTMFDLSSRVWSMIGCLNIDWQPRIMYGEKKWFWLRCTSSDI